MTLNERSGPDEWRQCACGSLVGVWRSKHHVSLSHKLPLCDAYDRTEEYAETREYLETHTTALTEGREAAAVEEAP